MRARLSMFLLLALAACGKPVPPDKSAYVGHWQSPTMSLLITENGRVVYRRKTEHGSRSVKGPLQGFDGDDFRVGVAMLATTFHVSTPPHRDGERWTMTVDGVELVRSD